MVSQLYSPLKLSHMGEKKAHSYKPFFMEKLKSHLKNVSEYVPPLISPPVVFQLAWNSTHVLTSSGSLCSIFHLILILISDTFLFSTKAHKPYFCFLNQKLIIAL